MTSAPTFEQNQGEGKDVASAINFSARALLGQNVCCCPDNRAFAGEGSVDGGSGSVLGHLHLPQFGRAKVEDLDVAIGTHEDVFRFEIAVGDAGGIGASESRRGLYGDV